MEKERFDNVARGLANGASRRSLVRMLGAAALGVGAVAVTSHGAEAKPYWDPDLLNPDKDDKDSDGNKTCRPRCLRRCRRQRQRCVLRTGNPFGCNRNCEDHCCDDDD